MIIHGRFSDAGMKGGGCLAELDQAVERLGPVDPTALSACLTREAVASGIERGAYLRSLAFRLAARRLIAHIRRALQRRPRIGYSAPHDVSDTIKGAKW